MSWWRKLERRKGEEGSRKKGVTACYGSGSGPGAWLRRSTAAEATSLHSTDLMPALSDADGRDRVVADLVLAGEFSFAQRGLSAVEQSCRAELVHGRRR